MSRLRRFGAFWFDFFVGDDWRLAVGAVLGLVVVDVSVRAGHETVWWLLPPVVIVTLVASLRHAVRQEPT